MTTTDKYTPGVRRDLLRRDPALARQLEQRARLMPGGALDRPVELSSASLVDVRAESTPCPLCEGRLRVEDDEVAHTARGPVRVAHVRCVFCGSRRALYFRIADTRAS